MVGERQHPSVSSLRRWLLSTGLCVHSPHQHENPLFAFHNSLAPFLSQVLPVYVGKEAADTCSNSPVVNCHRRLAHKNHLRGEGHKRKELGSGIWTPNEKQDYLWTLRPAGRICHAHPVKIPQDFYPICPMGMVPGLCEFVFSCLEKLWERAGRENSIRDQFSAITWVPVLGLQHCLCYRYRKNLITVLCLSQPWSYNPFHHVKNNVEESWLNSSVPGDEASHQIFQAGQSKLVQVAAVSGQLWEAQAWQVELR